MHDIKLVIEIWSILCNTLLPLYPLLYFHEFTIHFNNSIIIKITLWYIKNSVLYACREILTECINIILNIPELYLPYLYPLRYHVDYMHNFFLLSLCPCFCTFPWVQQSPSVYLLFLKFRCGISRMLYYSFREILTECINIIQKL